ncbi:hypothetical protein TRFO_39059 [Tritrichomonas foetus]|uniref:Uncharacterized protein n=1 Tax=Tritrichomonas foetus TaxID=1144522 RepID=A0A1J4J6A7_9EUKA|nr:hypothetical protein TRFO_39059 [Tritrichomonas foetus]|eukprot:OHS94770.1 hypothetical protein TRFO_39059 [Tritrichomonas foetus]
MSSKFQEFFSLIDLIVEPWTPKKAALYDQAIAEIKNDNEMDAILLLSIFFQVPRYAYLSTKKLCEKYQLQFHEIPNGLPKSFFLDFFKIFPKIASKKDRSYTRVVLICAQLLPKSTLYNFVIELMKNPAFHQVQAVFTTLLERDPSLCDLLVDNYEAAERGLCTILSSIVLGPFSEEFLFKVTALFISGKVSTTSPLFQAFCYYINRHLFTIDVQQTDFFILSLFKQLEAMYPHAHSYIYHNMINTLNYFSLPFVTIHMYYNDFDASQIKSILCSLVRSKGSIKSFFTLSQIFETQKLKELYSIAICGRFCRYEIMKKNIHFMKRSLDFTISLHFELRVLSKIIDIASFPEFEELSLQFLKIVKPFTTTARTLSAILKVFFTREKKRIPELCEKYQDSKANILTSLYLLGNSQMMTTTKKRTRYKSLVKSLIPQMGLKNFTIRGIMPKPLITYLTEKARTTKKIIQYFIDLSTQQLRPFPFDPQIVINMICMYQIDDSDLGHEIKVNDMKMTFTKTSDIINTDNHHRHHHHQSNNNNLSRKNNLSESSAQSDEIKLTESEFIEEKVVNVRLDHQIPASLRSSSPQLVMPIKTYNMGTQTNDHDKKPPISISDPIISANDENTQTYPLKTAKLNLQCSSTPIFELYNSDEDKLNVPISPKQNQKSTNSTSPIKINRSEIAVEIHNLTESSLLEEEIDHEVTKASSPKSKPNIPVPPSKSKPNIPKPDEKPNEKSKEKMNVKQNEKSNQKSSFLNLSIKAQHQQQQTQKVQQKSEKESRLPLQRPKSMSNIMDRKVDDLIEISSDGFNIELPSDDYDMYSEATDSLDEYSDNNEEIDPEIYNDEVVQMFADMFRPDI